MLPSEATIRGLPNVTNQGAKNRCVGEAVRACLQIEAAQKGAGWLPPLSADFLWWGGLEAIGAAGQNTGTYARDVLKYAAKVGAPLEGLYQDFPKPPGALARANALNHRTAAYYAPRGLQAVKAAIVAGNAVTFAFVVPQRLPNSRGSFPAYSGGEQDSHQIVAYGYDDHAPMGDGWGTGGLACMNWWGDRWGTLDPMYDGNLDPLPRRWGCFWVPYAVANDPNRAYSFWTVHDVPLL